MSEIVLKLWGRQAHLMLLWAPSNVVFVESNGMLHSSSSPENLIIQL